MEISRRHLQLQERLEMAEAAKRLEHLRGRWQELTEEQRAEVAEKEQLLAAMEEPVKPHSTPRHTHNSDGSVMTRNQRRVAKKREDKINRKLNKIARNLKRVEP